MTPNFALDLSEDGIVLLHRAPGGGGWFREGRVDFASGDIAEGLAKLRAKAIELEDENFQTKLVLPPSQLLFTTVDADTDIGEALAERTPYRADQLSYDTSGSGDQIHVVAVALETLGEAEGFITPHGLNPVGFTAIPEPGQFDGEPMLGSTLLGGDAFEPDTVPVKIIEKPTFLPKPVAPVVDEGAEKDTADTELAAKDVLAEKDSEKLADSPPEEVIEAPHPAEDPLPAQDTAAETKPAVEDAQETVAAPEPEPEPETTATIDTKVETTPAAAPDTQHDDPQPDETADVQADEVTSAAAALAAAVAATAPQAEGKPTPPATPAAFSSRRQGIDEVSEAKTGDRVTKLSTRIAVPNSAPKLGGAPAKTPPAAPKTQAEPPAPKVKSVTPAKAAPKPVPVVPPASPVQAPKTMPPAALAEQLTKTKPDPIAALAAKENRGKPRFLGLILTAILLICLGLAALLSSYVLPDNAISRWFGDGSAETEVAAAPDPTAPAEIDTIEPELPFDQGTDFASLPREEAFPEFNPDLNAAPSEPVVPAQPEPVVERRPEPITEAEAEAAYAATGIWQHAKTLTLSDVAPRSLDTLYIASLDPDPQFEDAPALLPQSPGGGEVEMVAFTPVPPPGVIFDIDERGLVVATPEGALNPDGIIVTLGAPSTRAIPRPTPDAPAQQEAVAPGTEAEPEVELATELAPETEPVPEVTPDAPEIAETEAEPPEAAPNPLAAFRPTQRPDNLTETRERATLGGLSRPELARIRPVERPVSARAQAEAIARALAEAEAETQAEAEAALVAATPQAVSASLRAQPRPANFNRVVARATPSPQAAPSQTASASTAAPSRGSGPAVARASRTNPTGPVSRTVARAATDNNAIALGNVSLVGVFGTSSNRRALVRMPNGRFKKVSVGDRVDGGNVAAIDGNSLRYTKRGRTVTLKMPSG